MSLMHIGGGVPAHAWVARMLHHQCNKRLKSCSRPAKVSGAAWKWVSALQNIGVSVTRCCLIVVREQKTPRREKKNFFFCNVAFAMLHLIGPLSWLGVCDVFSTVCVSPGSSMCLPHTLDS